MARDFQLDRLKPFARHDLDTIEDLLDTLLLILKDGDLAAWPNLEATTRWQFESLGVEFPDNDEEED